MCEVLKSEFFQSHLLGVFENVNEVEFSEKEYDRMLAVISREGEKVMVSQSLFKNSNSPDHKNVYILTSAYVPQPANA